MAFNQRNTWILLPVLGICVLVLYGFHWYGVNQRPGALAMVESTTVAQTRQAVTPPPHMTDLGGRAAPNFTLTDQYGKTRSLAQFRGKVIVVSFMDPLCTDLCPLVAQELRQAQAQLGANTKNVAFLAVNVNPYHASVQEINHFSTQHGYESLGNWHFLTGSPASLSGVWKEYGIFVAATPTGDTQHSEYTYIIDANGRERYLLNPNDQRAKIPQWSELLKNGIREAQTARV